MNGSRREMQTVLWGVLPTLLGFALAQLVNVVALLFRCYTKPRLRIRTVGQDHVLLDYPEELASRDIARKIIYGFQVDNYGLSVACGVRAFLSKTEIRDKSDSEFRQFSSHTSTLPWHGSGSDEYPAVLVPGGSMTVRMADWREDLFCVVPAHGMAELYEEICGGVAQFRFTVSVVEDSGEHASGKFTIDNPSVRRARDDVASSGSISEADKSDVGASSS